MVGPGKPNPSDIHTNTIISKNYVPLMKEFLVSVCCGIDEGVGQLSLKYQARFENSYLEALD